MLSWPLKKLGPFLSKIVGGLVYVYPCRTQNVEGGGGPPGPLGDAIPVLMMKLSILFEQFLSFMLKNLENFT